MLQRRIFRTACRVGGERVMGVVSSAAAKDGIFTLLLSGQGGPAFPRNGGLGPNVGIGGPMIKKGRTVAGLRPGCYLGGELRPAQIHLLNNAYSLTLLLQEYSYFFSVRDISASSAITLSRSSSTENSASRAVVRRGGKD